MFTVDYISRNSPGGIVNLRSGQRSAFSLVELSIVLVILGLLTGGILAGQSLIRAAELRSVSADTQKLYAALAAFRDKYFALPGDMAKATQFWTAANAVPATCWTTVGTGTQTCDGNGDGTYVGISGSYYERFHLWKQLANAGLIEGSFTGVTGPDSVAHMVPGINVPRGRLGNSGFAVVDYAAQATAADPYNFPGEVGTHLTYGGATSWQTNGPILKPEEAWNIDTKMDDGRPGTGRVKTYKQSWYTTCTDGDTISANYQLGSSAAGCSLLLLRMF